MLLHLSIISSSVIIACLDAYLNWKSHSDSLNGLIRDSFLLVPKVGEIEAFTGASFIKEMRVNAI